MKNGLCNIYICYGKGQMKTIIFLPSSKVWKSKIALSTIEVRQKSNRTGPTFWKSLSRHCENFWAFTGPRRDFCLILLILNMIIHRSFIGPTHLLSANIRGRVCSAVSVCHTSHSHKKFIHTPKVCRLLQRVLCGSTEWQAQRKEAQVTTGLHYFLPWQRRRCV